MADTKLDIILRLKDELSQGLDRANVKIQDFGKGITSAGRTLQRFSTNLAFFGTAATTPFIVALKSVEKYSYGVQTELAKTNNAWLQFNNTIAQAALPTIREFNSIFAKLVNTMNSVNPKLLEQIARWTLIGGAVAIVAGALGILISKLLILLGLIVTAVGWLGLWNVALVAIVGSLILFHDRFFEIINKLQEAWLSFVLFITETWQKFLQLVAKVPFANKFGREIDELTISIQRMKQELAGLQAGGTGSWSGGIQQGFTNLANTVNTWKTAFANASDQIGTMMVDMKTRVHDLAMSFADGFGDAFDKVLFEGQSFKESMKSLFQQMSRDIVKDFVKTGFKNIINKLFFPDAQQEGGQGVGGGLANMFLGMFSPLKQASNSTAQSMNSTGNATRNFGNILGTGQSALGGFFNSLTSFGGSLMGVAGSLIQGIGGLLGSLGGGLGGLLGGIGGGIGGGFMSLFSSLAPLLAFLHQGGMVSPIYAHSGLSPDEVPIIAQTGEGVLSRKGMRAVGGSDNLRRLNSGEGLGGGGQTIVVNQVIQAWDASDVYRNRRVISNALIGEIRNNGKLRKAIKES